MPLLSAASLPSRPPLRVALLGYGLAGRSFHAPFIASTPGLALAAVVTANPERAAQVAREHPAARVLPDADALWADPSGVDAVVIATPNRTHVPLARAALAARLPTVVDKPMTLDAAEAATLVRDFAAAGVPLTTYQNRRWDGAARTVRALLADGRLGRVHRIEARIERWRPQPRGGWRERPEPEEGGGLLWDLGPHLVDWALTLAGPAARVYAELDVRRPGVAVDDDVFVAITHASGVRSHLWASSLAGQRGPSLRVLGDRGAYVKFGVDPQEPALRDGDANPARPGWGEEPESAWGTLGAEDDVRPVPTMPGQWRLFYEAFARALRGDGPLPVDPWDAVAMLAVLDAARRSAREGRVIAVEPPARG